MTTEDAICALRCGKYLKIINEGKSGIPGTIILFRNNDTGFIEWINEYTETSSWKGNSPLREMDLKIIYKAKDLEILEIEDRLDLYRRMEFSYENEENVHQNPVPMGLVMRQGFHS